ncbi:MAG TPA: TIR domain-containing protein [Acidobacteria bacterium]|nr:TIR domain-containing protein [Acidobacteriota bacterium]HIM14699.1 TIR domain-containing protein [Acidobacteriota bacterium]
MSALASLYFAAPLFTHAERRWNRELARALKRDGHLVWLPQDKVEISCQTDVPSASSIFENALTGIRQADVVLAIIDGADPDSGTAFECGYAHALGTPILTVRTDFRRGGDDPGANVNLMLSQSASSFVVSAEPPATDSVEILGQRILEILAKLTKTL